jgi:hypothetical protein
LLESFCLFLTLLSPIINLELRWWNIADGFQEPAMIEPVDPFQSSVFYLIEVLPGSPVPYDLGLVEADDRLGQGVVVSVAPGSTSSPAAPPSIRT